jgi:hypothetical protein
MFDFFRNFRSFLKVHHYNNQQQLIADLGEQVIDPAEKWRSEARPEYRGPAGGHWRSLWEDFKSSSIMDVKRTARRPARARRPQGIDGAMRSTGRR